MCKKLKEDIVQKEQAPAGFTVENGVLKYKDRKTTRKEVEYKVGEWVYVKLQPYRKQSLARRPCEKLSARFYRPFEISHRVGQVAYRLILPMHSKVHPVFHIYKLKKAIGATQVSIQIPAAISEELVLEAEPEAIVGVRNNHPNAVEFLVKWVGMDICEATLEDM
ncbi:uncharacterized protein LOC141685199 [Apium graveolens]|uniref:uncharacterized protein LOC141685199 n=1 Tax=Apium graveolens TaxID=4045 RepID=UPI003D79D509